MRYLVASLDVVRSRDLGWEINDEHQVGTIDISQDVAEDDQLLLEVLIQSGYVDEGLSIEDVGFDAEDLSCMVVFSEDDGRPVLSLHLEQ